MYKISELVGIKLIDTNTEQDLGAIQDVIWDKPSRTCALVTDGGTFTAEKIVSSDGDVLNVIGAVETDVGETLIEKVAYETTGRTLGKVEDVEFGKTLKLAKVYLDDQSEYRRGRLVAVKDVLIIRAPTPPRPKKVKPIEAPAVANTTAATEQNVVVANFAKQITNAPWNQNRKYGDFSFLIGKMTDKTITNFQGEVMVKHGERVTHDILRQAKISGKLIELCLHTK